MSDYKIFWGTPTSCDVKKTEIETGVKVWVKFHKDNILRVVEFKNYQAVLSADEGTLLQTGGAGTHGQILIREKCIFADWFKNEKVVQSRKLAKTVYFYGKFRLTMNACL